LYSRDFLPEPSCFLTLTTSKKTKDFLFHGQQYIVFNVSSVIKENANNVTAL